MKLRPGITPKLTFIFVGFAALLLAGVASLAYTSGRNALRQAAISELQSVATEKESALIEWEQDKLSAMQTIASLPEVQQDMIAFHSATSGSPEARAAHDQLIDQLSPWAGDDKEFLGLLVMNPDTAAIIAATRASEEGKFKENFPYFIHGREGSYLQSAYYSPELQGLAMTVSAPVRTTDGRLLGVLAARLNLDQLNEIIQRRSGLHQTDDAFLVSASNLFVTQPRFISNPAVLRRGIHSEAVKRCLPHEDGALAYSDYRGEPAIGVYRWLPEFDVCLIVKLDQSEAFEPSRAFGQTVLILSLAALGVALVVAIGLARTIVRPLQSLQSGVVRFGQGDLDARLSETSRDELGVLAHQFNQMATSLAEKDAQLREYATQLEQRVVERTAQLRAETAERIQAEEKLHITEERYRRFFENMHEIFVIQEIIMDDTGKPIDLRFIDINPAAERFMGKTRNEILGRSRSELSGRADPEGVEMASRVASTGSPFHMVRYSPGFGGWFESFTYSLGSGMVATLSLDITERKQAEEALSQTEKRLRALIENSWDAIALFGADGTILYGSPSTIQILGYPLDEFVGRNAFELIHEEDQALVTERMTMSLQQPGAHIPVYARVRHKNGEWRWLEGVFTNLLDDPSVQAIVNNYHDFTERKRDEDALHTSESRKTAIIESSLDALITIDHQGHILEFNPAAQEVFGYTESEAVGKEMAELIIPPLLREQHRSGLARYLSTGEARVLGKRIEITAIRSNGTEFPVELAINRIKGEEPPIFTGFIRDISGRKLTEETLLASEERFRLVVEAAPSAMIAVDRDGKINLVNAKAQEFFGYHQDELLGRPVEMLIPQRFRSGHPLHRQGFVAQPTSRPMGAGRDLFGLHKDGHEIPIEIGLTPYESSEGMFTIALIVDITERKRAEEEIRKLNDELKERVVERTAALSQANALLQTLLDYMPDHIYFKDAQSRFIRNSRSQARALGLNDSAEAIGKSDFDFFPHAQLSYEREQEIIRSGKPLVDLEERVVWPDGRETWVSTTKMPLVDQAGQIIGTFGISRDITERKRSESALQKAKLELEAANRELEAFSYSVSHDLRSPLRTIDGFSQALLEDYGQQLPEEAQGHLARVRSAAQRMAVLIDDLLNLSRVTRSHMKSVPVDLSVLAQGIATELQRTHRERNVNFSIAPNLKAQGDPHLLHVALENLLSNAWKFTSKREKAEVQFGSRDENGETIYFIHDNGAGFDMVYAGKLFGAFQRLHGMAEFPGTGIGLATVQRIIHRHGGRVWAEAEVDQGATFFFTLPSLKRARPRTAPKEEDSIAKRAREII